MNLRNCHLILFALCLQVKCFAQFEVNIPSSPILNVFFGSGVANPGPPISQGYTDFTFTNTSCPPAGSYTIVNNSSCGNGLKNDAGHIFFGPHPVIHDPGYMMVASYQPSSTSLTVFRDTVKNLCSNNSYLFWAAIRNPSGSPCVYPNLTFSVETVNGTTIQSYNTGDIGGAADKGRPYFNLTGIDVLAAFPYFYGFVFTLPAGVNDVVLKIYTTPTPATNPCSAIFAIDNILLNAVGTTPTISITGNSDGFLTSTCFQGSSPLNLNAETQPNYLDFNSGDYVTSAFNNIAYQWQQSLDSGYTWIDIAGQTNQNLSKIFSNPDTFFVRLRISDASNINNQNCSVLSNVVQVNVDGPVQGFDITSNSPVCEDSDIVLKLSGGATYITTGPNNFLDNSSFPHVYHPTLADSGWYTTKVITQGGCYAYDSTFVKVVGPNLKTSFFPDSVCYGRPIQLMASGASTYVWAPADYLNNANIANPISTPKKTIQYQVQATDNFGCSAFNSLTVHVRDTLLKAGISSADIFCPNDVASFTDSSIGKITKWFWSFGNGETSAAKNPSLPHYSYEGSITYPIQLIVTDFAGCADTAVKIIKTVSNCYIAVPSAFTPNNDGVNDYLYPLNAYKATNLSFSVFNRFGKLIFYTKDWTKKWDGKINNIPQPAGTYIWILNYVDEDGQHINLKGTSVLIR